MPPSETVYLDPAALTAVDLLRVIAYVAVPHSWQDAESYQRSEWMWNLYPAAVARDGLPTVAMMEAPSTMPAPILEKAPPSWGTFLAYVNRLQTNEVRAYVARHAPRVAQARRAMAILTKAGY